jgi:Co/Zn/Cd efflux system component
MIVVSALALMANAYCLYLLQKSKSKEEAHMKASLIFTSNDVIINLGVIAAGLLVNWLNSGMPDLVIGSIVFLLVINGALRILKLGNENLYTPAHKNFLFQSPRTFTLKQLFM